MPLLNETGSPEQLRAEPAPLVSFIVPAFNAGRTLDRTLRGLARQSVGDWQALIVDDGSSDDTAAVAEAWSRRDPRMRLIRQANAGVSAARNRGLDAAEGSWITFLDADDTLDPSFLRRMLDRAQVEPGADVICCGYARVDERGRTLARYAAPQLEADATPAFAQGTPTTIHAYLIQREAIARSGAFDEVLATSEDWDFGLRLARAGCRFASEPRILASYWNTPGSQTKDAARLVRDRLKVLERARGPDARVRTPLQAYAEGVPDALTDGVAAEILFWAAGIAVGAGQEGEPLIGLLNRRLILPPDVERLKVCFESGLNLGLHGPWRDLPPAWPELQPAASRFAEAIERRCRSPGFRKAFIGCVERGLIVLSARDCILTQTAGLSLTPGLLLNGAILDRRIDILILRLPLLRPRRLFTFTLPISGVVSGRDVRKAMLSQFRWRASRYLSTRSLPHPLLKAAAGAIDLARRIKGRLGRMLRRPEPGWKLEGRQAWDEFFATEDPWNYAGDYERQKYARTLEMLPEGPIGRVLELACAEGRFTVDLAARVGQLSAVDISSKALVRAEARCAKADNVRFGVLDFFKEDFGYGWDLIVCSEVLYYLPSQAELPAIAARLRDALAEGGHLLHAHARTLHDDPTRTGFDRDHFGSDTIRAALEATEGLKLVKSLDADLYRIDLFRKTGEVAAPALTERPLKAVMEPRIAADIVWNGATQRRGEAERRFLTAEVPVLMYHRIAEDGPEGLSRWRTSPEAFEAQLRFLRRRGFRSIAPAEWAATSGHAWLRGRPIMITFDDGYRDFQETAWPILQRNGFGGHVFVCSGQVGGEADWDADHGEPAPLMDWDDIRSLRAQGVTFGSHFVSHRRADRLDSAELMDELSRSRQRLEAELGETVSTVAPPFGCADDRIAMASSMAGYERLFLAGGGLAPTFGRPMATPRVEVMGGWDLEAFHEALGPGIEPPERGELHA